MREVLDGVDEAVLVVDGDWRVAEANAAARELFDHEEEGLVGADVREAFPASVESTFARRYGGEDPDRDPVDYEEYFPDLEAWLSVRTAPVEAGLAVYLRDVTERRRLAEDLSDKRAELSTLDRINRIIGEVIDDLVGAGSREEVETTVCERLAAADLYELAWIAEPGASGPVRRAAAGDHDAVLDRVVAAATDEAGPEARAMADDQRRVVRQLATDPDVPEPVRQESFAHGLQSALAVPLSYGNTVYGALGVYAARPDAFTDDELTAFDTLGATVGFAINAARQRNLLLSDTVVELVFRVTDDGALFAALSRDLDCSVAVEGLVPRDDDELSCYVRVDADAAGEVLSRAGADPAVAGTRSIDGDGDRRLLEVTLTGRSPALTLVEGGAVVRSVSYDEGTGRVVAELGPDEDVRGVVEAVGGAFPDSELVAKRDRERTVETARDFRSDLRDRLTDRQRTVLRTAYFADYFESPRGSTGEELAATLGISSPTLHQHLRAGQKKILSGLFEDPPGADDPARTRTTDPGAPFDSRGTD